MFLYNGQYGVVTDSNGLYYMRARYYNVDIKRFINQDVIEGSITNSPSLNKYAYCQGNPINQLDPFGLSPMSQNEGKNLIRDILGFVPGDGSLADKQIQDCIKNFNEGNYWDAVQLLFGLMPMMGDVIGGTSIFGLKGTCLGDKFIYGAGMLGSLGTFGISLKNIYDVSSELSNKHILLKQDWDQDSWMLLSKGLMNVGIALLSAVEFATSLDGYVNSTCFIAGTMVLTIAGNKAIEEIEAGDLVYSTNPETGESEYKEVARVFRRESDVIIHVFVNGEEIETTPDHPFWVEDQWVHAKDLREGDILTLADGTTAAISKTYGEQLDEPVIVYNFEVQDFHTYYVTDTGVLVHNANYSVLDDEYIPNNKSLTLDEALQKLENSGLKPGQTVISESRINEILESFDSKKAFSSIYTDSTGRYIVDGHHTTVAATMLGEGTGFNMNLPTSQMPSATNICWVKKWYEFWKTAIKVIE